jgi:hypothetical protein
LIHLGKNKAFAKSRAQGLTFQALQAIAAKMTTAATSLPAKGG